MEGAPGLVPWRGYTESLPSGSLSAYKYCNENRVTNTLFSHLWVSLTLSGPALRTLKHDLVNIFTRVHFPYHWQMTTLDYEKEGSVGEDPTLSTV
jgi:hypothetical protein